jgi:hypothetical protein
MGNLTTMRAAKTWPAASRSHESHTSPPWANKRGVIRRSLISGGEAAASPDRWKTASGLFRPARAVRRGTSIHIMKHSIILLTRIREIYIFMESLVLAMLKCVKHDYH